MTEELPTVPHYLEAVARSSPDRLAVVEDGIAVSYQDLMERSRRMAGAFIFLGMQPGERIAIWLPNGIEWMVASLGAHYAACVVVPLNTRFQRPEAEFILARSGASLVVTTSDFLGRDYVVDTMAIFPGLAELKHVVDVREPRTSGVTSWARLLMEGLATEREIDERLDAIKGEDVSDILFTSGTTGYPKGVMISHRGSVHAVQISNERLLLRSDDVHVIVIPFFHMFGYKYGWECSIMLGSCVAPTAVFDPARTARLVQAVKATVLSGPPTIFQSLITMPDRESYDLSTLRLSVTGSARVPPTMVQQMKHVLGIPHIVTGYGLTESTGAGTYTMPDADIDTVATTVGHTVRDVELRIVDPQGSVCAPDEPGEIQIRSICVTKGYYDDPNATAEAIDPEGWLHTGDIGALGIKGDLRILGRIKDVIIVGGMNVYPAEVERVLAAHDLVRDAAVIGRDHERLGEVPIAYVELEPSDGLVDGKFLIDWCRGQLANFKLPREVVVLDALPRNAMGKIRKHELSSPGDAFGLRRSGADRP